jgi:antitoxin (DNA-binding transcriptional repressor) of toxin-antitoxin stability system
VKAKTSTRCKSYTVARAKAQFESLLADVAAGCVVEITSQGRAVASVLPPEILETLEIMSNREAMRAIRAAGRGRISLYPASVLEGGRVEVRKRDKRSAHQKGLHLICEGPGNLSTGKDYLKHYAKKAGQADLRKAFRRADLKRHKQ